MVARFTIALLVAIIAQAMAATGPVITGYYNVFSGYQIKGFGCMEIDPTIPVTVSSWNLGQCQPYTTASGLKQTILSMSTDSLTLYMDVYSSTDCSGDSTKFQTTLQEPTEDCTWSYTESIPPMQESAPTLAATHVWQINSYFTSETLCDSKSTPAFVYQSELLNSELCASSCVANTNNNGFSHYSQECIYNPFYAPTSSPVPTMAPTVVNNDDNNDAIIIGAVIGAVLFLALLAGLYYCYGQGGGKTEDEFERLRVDAA